MADLQTPLGIGTLCRALSVSERTLRKAFHRIHGQPPHHCLRMFKLSRARGELMMAHGRPVTVTEIATALGFVELGRFSVEYRRAFGESPSETMRQAFREHGGDDRALNDRVAFTKVAPDREVATATRRHPRQMRQHGASDLVDPQLPSPS